MAQIPLDPQSPDTGRRPSLRNRPVLLGNLVAALVLEVCVLLRSFGVPLTDAQADSINGVAGLLLLIGASLWAERHTTPLNDPRNQQGEPLVTGPAPPKPNPIGGQSPE